jgi:hypothetical protein
LGQFNEHFNEVCKMKSAANAETKKIQQEQPRCRYFVPSLICYCFFLTAPGHINAAAAAAASSEAGGSRTCLSVDSECQMMISISNQTDDDAGVDEQEVKSAVTCLSSGPRQYRLMLYSVVIFGP